jgi:hypothetical protein
MATAEFLDLRPLYFADRRFVAKVEDVELRFPEAGKWLRALNVRRDLSVAARNQVLFDAVHLLAGDWTEQKANDWNFVDLADLQKPLAALKTRRHWRPVTSAFPPNGLSTPNEVLSELGTLVEKANAETHATYADFRLAEMQRRQQDGERFSEIEDYSLWFSRNRPYLALDLEFSPEMDDDAVEAAIQERLDFFVAPLPENSNLEFHYGQIARQYIDLKLVKDMKAAGK